MVVLAGEGDAFCAGTDPAALADLASLDAAELPPALAELRVAEAVAAVEKPVIAALSGDAFDQGLELALACDVRVASLDARFGMTQLARGVLPWDGGTQRLPRLVGRAAATEMLLTGATPDAARAVEIGLVNETVEPERVVETGGRDSRGGGVFRADSDAVHQGAGPRRAGHDAGSGSAAGGGPELPVAEHGGPGGGGGVVPGAAGGGVPGGVGGTCTPILTFPLRGGRDQRQGEAAPPS